MSKKRITYLMIALVLLAVEVFIALFVKDKFIRPYVGDVLVVIVIYAIIRTFVPDGCRLLPVYIFVFAAGVEVLQMLDIVGMLGLADNKFFSVLIGSTFDIKDIVCYAVGCLLLGVYEHIGCKLTQRP